MDRKSSTALDILKEPSFVVYGEVSVLEIDYFQLNILH